MESTQKQTKRFRKAETWKIKELRELMQHSFNEWVFVCGAFGDIFTKFFVVEFIWCRVQEESNWCRRCWIRQNADSLKLGNPFFVAWAFIKRSYCLCNTSACRKLMLGSIMSTPMYYKQQRTTQTFFESFSLLELEMLDAQSLTGLPSRCHWCPSWFSYSCNWL